MRRRGDEGKGKVGKGKVGKRNVEHWGGALDLQGILFIRKAGEAGFFVPFFLRETGICEFLGFFPLLKQDWGQG